MIAPPPALQTHELRTPDDLRHYTLLRHVVAPLAWSVWLQAHGVPHLAAPLGPLRTLASSLIAAVSVGQGVALMPECLVRPEVQRGALSVPFAPFVHSEGYFLSYPERALALPAFQAFRAWLLALAERTLQAPV